MILICPQCATRYQVDEATFPPSGRAVRCAKCRHIWHHPDPATEIASGPVLRPRIGSQAEIPDWPSHLAPGVIPPAVAIASAQPQPSADLAERPPTLGPKRAKTVAGWGGLIAFFLIALSVMHHGTDKMILRRLASRQSLASVSLKIQGVDLRNVRYRREIDDGQPVMILIGTITNGADRALPVPKTIRITLSDEKNNRLFSAAIPAHIATLEPGRSVTFRARIHDLPLPNPRLHMSLED